MMPGKNKLSPKRGATYVIAVGTPDKAATTTIASCLLPAASFSRAPNNCRKLIHTAARSSTETLKKAVRWKKETNLEETEPFACVQADRFDHDRADSAGLRAEVVEASCQVRLVREGLHTVEVHLWTRRFAGKRQ